MARSGNESFTVALVGEREFLPEGWLYGRTTDALALRGRNPRFFTGIYLHETDREVGLFRVDDCRGRA
jgi:hypothetical protein